MCSSIVLPPHIITHPTDTSAAAPFSGVFTCSARGYGHLNISWYKKENQFEKVPGKCIISQVDNVSTTTSTLIIPNVTDDEIGTYYCVVWANKRATQSETATLYKSSMYILLYNCISHHMQ